MLAIIYRYSSIICLLAAIVFTACTSAKNDAPTPLVADGLSWTVDGAASTTNTYTTSSPSANNLVTVIGQLNVNTSTTNSQLMLDMPRTVGTYPFGPATLAGATYISSANNKSKVYFAGYDGRTLIGSGTIVVTEITASRIKGTFAFTGIDQLIRDTKSITNGTFNVGL
ncbi:DUF6252 family protein [Hymenobacter humi]|uniref:DUF6252 family protein n=1 Tax=Hymenobacter humi TaxID=1411620 RepID=A0ABW2U7X7_9BACT